MVANPRTHIPRVGLAAARSATNCYMLVTVAAGYEEARLLTVGLR
jgi:hypothetical protein